MAALQPTNLSVGSCYLEMAFVAILFDSENDQNLALWYCPAFAGLGVDYLALVQTDATCIECDATFEHFVFIHCRDT